jgi:cytochrome c oxidase subunit 2
VLRSRHTIPLLIIAIVIGGITAAVALFIDWVPEQAAEQAARVDNLMWFVIWSSVVIFTLVATVVVYAAFRFRAKPGDESDGPPTHGNTTLEIVWTVVPTVLLAVVAVWAYLVLADNEALAKDRVVINVTAQQFAWEFYYPGGQVGSGDLHVPVNRQVELKMRSKDVIHDFYVVQFRVKEDIVPGITTNLVFNPNKIGTYQVICAELCGVGHGIMRSRIIVQSQEDYDAWLAQSAAKVKAGAAKNQGGGSSATPAEGSTTAPAEGSTTAPAEGTTTAP